MKSRAGSRAPAPRAEAHRRMGAILPFEIEAATFVLLEQEWLADRFGTDERRASAVAARDLNERADAGVRA